MVQVTLGDPVALTLNTGRRFDLEPGALLVCGESLYLTLEGERVKFTVRAMLKLSEAMELTEAGYALRVGGRVHPIPELELEASRTFHESRRPQPQGVGP